MKIGNISIGINDTPFIIAEMSGNHNQSLERAMSIVESAAKSGANALKLQTYTADTITLNIKKNEFVIDDDSLWEGEALYDLYNKACTPWEWHYAIIERANDLGMLCFSSPFDESAVDFLEDLNVPAYKIASFENNHLPLIRKVASTGKPMIISTGMATIAEIYEAVTTARESGCKDLILLKCTSTYPATPKDSNILTIPHMRKMFDCEVGLSDHTMGIGASVAAIAHGATIIEKHFTIDRSDGGVDSDFSLEPNEFELLVKESERAWHSLGSVYYGGTESEKKSKVFRRSVYVSCDIKAGEVFTEKNITSKRPGNGISPYKYWEIIGQKAPKNYSADEPLDGI